MRLCVLSNSHGAALKWALTETDIGKHAEIVLFGVPNRGLKGLEPDESGRTLRPRNEATASVLAVTSGGLREVVIADFDAFLVHGLFLYIPRLDQRHSTAVRSEAIRAMLDQALGLNLARSIARLTKAPVIISPDPLYADLDAPLYAQRALPPTRPVAYADVCAAVQNMAGLGGIRFLPQPSETIGTRLDTLPDYCTGSRRILNDEVHREADRRHMNGSYGALVLRDALAVLAA